MRAVTIYTNLCDKVLLIDYSAQCSDFLIVMYWMYLSLWGPDPCPAPSRTQCQVS